MDTCPEIHVDADVHQADNECIMLRDEEDVSTLSARVCRRRSSSSIRFADDTDTGTDILMITEETLDDILFDPTGTSMPSSSELSTTRKMSSPTTTSSTPHFLGVHRFQIAGAGALMVPCGENKEYQQNRMLLTLRRRKSFQKSIHIDPIALLDYSYHGVTDRFLLNASNWSFNSFTLDTLTGGHSLSLLLVHLFTKYKFIETFDLDIVNVWKVFRLFENGYHDTNPYHNSVHAADVTQAMHCFIEEERIGKYMTPMEKMCALLAAVAHDLDHPGVNQHFLIATKSHLASLYNNLSVLESHHWRFAISCILESKVFDHFTSEQWQEVQHLLSSLIMATDITQQASYLNRFRQQLSSSTPFCMSKAEDRLFILQIALKCADLGNPCRPWVLSHKWTTQICSEFYRQGDYEKMLNIEVNPMFDRRVSSMAKIQTEFFRNIVSPLFELWDQFLCSRLSRMIINNLKFNNSQWESSISTLRITRRHSDSSTLEISAIKKDSSKSHNDLSEMKEMITLEELKRFSQEIKIKVKNERCNGVDGCGTPTVSFITTSTSSEDFEDCLSGERSADNFENNIPTPFSAVPGLSSNPLPPLSSHSLFDTAQYLSGRRGSAPGCIGIYTSCELAAAAALVFLHGAVTSQHQKRRSSFPVERTNGLLINTNTNNANNKFGAKFNNWSHFGHKVKGRSLEVLMTSLSANNKLLTRQACSLDSGAEFKQWLLNSKPRRASVPQEILIESLTNYISHDGL
ncbi:uncharacterized protein B4U79_11900 [Dinothrombium tinctorium]|uniref:Phosphodiesterase n=1 Tax=Dinothrombium tinctorium TaxID=1965070 RepID=A0A443QUI0_9ACAR|nr:uncharacterized protein B4U79_07796 [Dinothrombium tinctorium]RWS06664.1 uncharacterized protein B4U79_11900 [Dinothrombium tinctorium]